MAKGTVFINQDHCKGCQLCLPACPSGLLQIDSEKLNTSGYHPAMLVDPDHECTGCAICAVICPDVCMTVFREGQLKHQTPLSVN